jgi:hypothetical protein
MKPKTRKIISLLLITIMLLFTAISFTASADKVSDNDLDGDGLTNADENATGTDPENPDTDGDGLIDSVDEEPNDDGKIHQYHGDEKGRFDAQNSLVNMFLFVFLLSFAVFSLLAGVFTAYFGAGKSRLIGGVLLAIGVVIILIWVYFGLIQDYPDDTIFGVLHWEAARTMDAFITVLGAVVGAVLAIVLFLVAIMKS